VPPPTGAYLLDTNVVLHATRENSPLSAAVEAQFDLTSAPFQPAICEVTIGELYAFAQDWGERRRTLLERVISQLVVIPISDPRIHRRWGELYSYARESGLAIRSGHNDIWIAATAFVSNTTLLSTDAAAFLPLRGTAWLSVVVLDPHTGLVIP
jgi:predicted nucleic acid-binding protein